jgi:hypothetical protein
MHSPAPDVGGTHATPVEASATTASERIVRDKIYCNKKDCRESSESIPKHGASSLLIWGNSIGAFRLARRFDAGLAKQYLIQPAALSLWRLDINQWSQRSFGLHSNGNIREPHMSDLVVIAFPTAVRRLQRPKKYHPNQQFSTHLQAFCAAV